MNFEPIIDLKQFKSDEELNAFAHDYFSKFEENRTKVEEQLRLIKEGIKRKLSERNSAAYNVIVGITETAEYEKNRIFDTELEAFKIAVEIYKMEERQQESTVFDSIESVGDFYRLLMRLRFLMLRLLLGVDENASETLYQLLLQKRLSIYVPVHIIRTGEFGSKEKLFMILSDLYYEHGLYKEALFVICVGMSEAGAEYLDAMDKTRLHIMEQLNG